MLLRYQTLSDNPKFCGKCGSSLTNEMMFCTNCGIKVTDLGTEKSNIVKISKSYETPRTYLFITIILGIFGGIPSYVNLRRKYPKEAKRLLLLGIVVSFVWLVALANVGNDDSVNDNKVPEQTKLITKGIIEKTPIKETKSEPKIEQEKSTELSTKEDKVEDFKMITDEFTKKLLTDEESNDLSIWIKGNEKYYANLDRFNDHLLEDIDRGIWYLALTLDNQNQFDEFCKNAKKAYELAPKSNYVQVKQIGIDTVEKSQFYNDMYLEICIYNKVELWNLGKELSYVSQGNKPLDEDILKAAANKALVLQNQQSVKPQSVKSYAKMSPDYCTALRQWMNEYQGSEWLTHDALIEYDRVC